MSSVVYAVLLVYVALSLLLLLGLFIVKRRATTTPTTTTTTIVQDLTRRRALAAFVPKDRQERSDAVETALPTLAPVDCNTVDRFCLQPENCRLFCKDAAVMSFDCVAGVCVERLDNSSSVDSSSTSSGCNTKNGEFGLLVGYTELGVAQWDCVQLYPGWEDRGRYCENGVVSLDARVREPSYADCQCPTGTTRMVYRRSVLGNTVYGLPHCVPEDLVEFYKLSYRTI